MILKIIQTGSKGNCILLEHGERYLMLDAGIKEKDIYKAVDYKISSIDGCLVTHDHQDHAKSVPFLHSQFVTVVAPEEGVSGHISDWAYTAFSLEHDTNNVGYIIQHRRAPEHRIGYITDTGYCKYSPVGLTALLIECSYTDEVIDRDKEELGELYIRLKKNHMSLARVLSFLKKIDRSKLRTIVLTHLSETNSNEKRMVAEVKSLTGVDVYAARNGMQISLEEVPW